MHLLVACCYAAALQCLAPFPRRFNRAKLVTVAIANAMQWPLRPNLVGWYPRLSRSSIKLWATSGSPRSYGIEQGRNHLSVRDARDTLVHGMITGYDNDYGYGCVYVCMYVRMSICMYVRM